MEKTNVIYILNPDDTESDLVGHLIGSLPQVFNAGELGSIVGLKSKMHGHCSCGQKLSACSFWSNILSRDYNLSDNLGRLINYKIYLGILTGHRMKMADNDDITLFQKIADRSNVDIITESSNSISRLYNFGQHPQLEVKVVYLTSDPLTIIRRSKPSAVFLVTLLEHRIKHLLIHRLLRQFKPPYCILNIDKVYTYPQTEINRLSVFLGMPISLESEPQKNNNAHTPIIDQMKPDQSGLGIDGFNTAVASTNELSRFRSFLARLLPETTEVVLDFIGIGSEKSGTTWVADMLDAHPEIQLSKQKELHYFNLKDVHYLKPVIHRFESKGLLWLARQFYRTPQPQLLGEFSPGYMYCDHAARRIHEHNPCAKLVVVLRNPVDRAFSQYIHDKKLGVIGQISFEEALDAYPNYIEKGYYHKYLTMYLHHFDVSQIHILFKEDIDSNPRSVISRLYQFIGVKDTQYMPPNYQMKVNIASQSRLPCLNIGITKSKYLLRRFGLAWLLNILGKLGITRLSDWIQSRNTMPITRYPSLNDSTKSGMIDIYRDDIKKLEQMLNRDLSHWLQ